MFNEQTREFEPVNVPPGEYASLGIYEPTARLFTKGQTMKVLCREGYRECILHDITRKDLVVLNKSWLKPGEVVIYIPRKLREEDEPSEDDEDAKPEPQSMKLRVRARSGKKTYLRPVVDNTITIKKGAKSGR